MLNFPDGDSRIAQNVARELSRIDSSCPNVMAWLRAEEVRLQRQSGKIADDINLRWNQGGQQVLASLFKCVLESRDIYNNLTKGE